MTVLSRRRLSGALCQTLAALAAIVIVTAAGAVTAASASVIAVEGQPFTAQLTGAMSVTCPIMQSIRTGPFQVCDPGAVEVNINWGDNTSSTYTAGGVNCSATSCTFGATGGSHIYVNPGPYTITVSAFDIVNDPCGPGRTPPCPGPTASATIAATISDAPLLPGPAAVLHATEGASSGPLALATFRDTDPGGTGKPHTAVVDWGDGSSGAASVAPSGGSFVVTGAHTYAKAGTYTAVITIADPDGARTTATDTVQVADAPLAGAAVAPLSVMAGAPLGPVTLATFTDADPNGTIGGNGTQGDYSAKVDWGDGTPAAQGAFSARNGAFVVSGSHTYAGPGVFTVSVVIADVDGAPTTVHDTVTVPPTCADVAARTPAGGGAVSIGLACTGPAGGGLDYTIVRAPEHGSLGAIDQGNGRLVYTPASGFDGQDTFTYQVRAGSGDSNVATATITIPPQPPTCGNVAAHTAPGGGAAPTQLACSAPAGVVLSYAIVSAPAHGSLSAIGNGGGLVYVPRLGYYGTDAFTYQATDSGGASNTATATVTIERPLGTLAFALLGWDFTPLRTYSTVTSMRASALPVGTAITVSCQGQRCPFSRRTTTVTTRARCQAGSRRCVTQHPAHTRAIDLTALVKGRRFPAGSQLVVTFSKSGFVGKVYVFAVRSLRQPTWVAACEAPGSRVPGRGC